MQSRTRFLDVAGRWKCSSCLQWRSSLRDSQHNLLQADYRPRPLRFPALLGRTPYGSQYKHFGHCGTGQPTTTRWQLHERGYARISVDGSASDHSPRCDQSALCATHLGGDIEQHATSLEVAWYEPLFLSSLEPEHQQKRECGRWTGGREVGHLLQEAILALASFLDFPPQAS